MTPENREPNRPTPAALEERIAMLEATLREKEVIEAALRRNQAMLARTEGIAHVGSWEWEVATDTVTWSEELFRIFQLNPADGAPPYAKHAKLYQPQDMARLNEAVETALNTGTPYVLELHAIRADGEVRVCVARGHAEVGPDGSINRLVGSLQDITERKQAEEALRESEERFRVVWDISSDAMALSDPEGTVIAVNPAYGELYGYPREAVVGRSFAIIFPAEQRQVAAEQYRAIFASPEIPPAFESQVRRVDGVERIVESRISFIYQNGQRTAMLSTIRDITERKLAEENLKKYKNIVSSTPDGLAMLDENYRYIIVNDAYERFSGVNQEQFLGKTVAEYLGEEVFRQYIKPNFDRCVGGETITYQEWFDYPTLGRRYVEVTYFPYRDIHNIVTGVVSTTKDITERKQAEAEREKLQAQLLQAQKMESVGRLAGGVAHDFNNMLMVILGRTEMALRRVEPTQPIHADLEEIHKAAQHSADLTRQLLAFARKQIITPRLLDLNDTVTGMLKMLQRLIGEDINLVWKPSVRLWPVMMDPTQIDQILANLAVNARDAIAGVGKLTIETENAVLDAAYCAGHAGAVPGDYVMLAVSDTGAGMDKETMEHLFEPFFTTKGLGYGTGLGLATVYGIIKQNNGYVSVSSEPGQGAIFKIYLPRHPDEETLFQYDSSTIKIIGGSETILLVEDELAILEMTEIMLEEFGYRVLTASTPEAAIRLAEAHANEIHLLITDVVMPGMNGRDLAEQLLALSPTLKCLFMSGYTADVIAHRGVVSNDVSFIQKPFTMKHLAAKVREMLG